MLVLANPIIPRDYGPRLLKNCRKGEYGNGSLYGGSEIFSYIYSGRRSLVFSRLRPHKQSVRLFFGTHHVCMFA